MRKYSIFLLFTWLVCNIYGQGINNATSKSGDNRMTIPTLQIEGTNSHDIMKAYRIAIGDVAGNIKDFKSPGLNTTKSCLYAGLYYDKPWTRDTSINVWNGFCFLSPEVAKNTLLSQLFYTKDKKLMIDGEYWDKVIWSIGAWQYYLSSGDADFLKIAYKALKNTLPVMEREEFSSKDGLFRGAAVYGDGVAAYPDVYTTAEDTLQSGSYSGIIGWLPLNPTRKNHVGVGLPMYSLSTNAVYYETYLLLKKMAGTLKENLLPEWNSKASHLKVAINHDFWMADKGTYRYLVDSFGNCNVQEGMGLSLSILFDIPTPNMKEAIFAHTITQPAGIPCLYPCFPRYHNEKQDSYGRHSGTVWPHIQGFWADAAAKNGKYDLFMHEFTTLTQHAVRDNQFVEIYHPITGLPYGGLQEPTKDKVWYSGERQTWSATAYLRMIFYDIVGISLTEEGISFHPYLPQGVHSLSLSGLSYRHSILTIAVKGEGTKVRQVMMDGKTVQNASVPASITGEHHILISMEK